MGPESALRSFHRVSCFGVESFPMTRIIEVLVVSFHGADTNNHFDSMCTTAPRILASVSALSPNVVRDFHGMVANAPLVRMSANCPVARTHRMNI